MTDFRLLIIGSNTRAAGGIPKYINEQISQLPDSIDTTVYDVESPGTTVYDIESPEETGTVWFIKAFISAVVDAITFPLISRPDIVHIHTGHWWSFYRSSFYVLFSAYIWKIPVILHVHGSSFDEFTEANSRWIQLLQSVTYDAADEIIVLSDYWKELLQQQVNEEKITIIPNAVDPGLYTPSTKPNPIHIVFISDLIPRKGIVEFTEAIATLLSEGDRDIKVTIAGTGPLSNYVEELSDKYNGVEYLGYVSEEKKQEILNNGTIFVLPSYAEGLPIAILEAMAGGNAIISTKVGSIPEVVAEENGLLIEPGNVTQLQHALQELVNSPSKVEKMAVSNRELIEKQYSWSFILSELQKRYKSIINDH